MAEQRGVGSQSLRLGRRARLLVLAAPLALVAALVAGFAIAGRMPGMAHGDAGQAAQPLEQLSGDAFDQAFLRAMIQHHAIAVLMTRPVVARAEQPELKLMGEQIIKVHMDEIAQMRGWLKEWYGVGVPDPLADEQAVYAAAGPAGLDMGGMSHAGMAGMSAAGDASGMPSLPMGGMSTLADFWRLPPGRLDAVYMSLMIPHHEAAIAMTNLAPERARRQEVKDLALAINRLQTREVLQMQRWLLQWFRL